MVGIRSGMGAAVVDGAAPVSGIDVHPSTRWVSGSLDEDRQRPASRASGETHPAADPAEAPAQIRFPRDRAAERLADIRDN